MMEKLTLWPKLEILFASTLTYIFFITFFLGAGDLVFVDNDLGKIIFNVLKKLIDNFCTIVKLPNNNRHKVSEDVDQI